GDDDDLRRIGLDAQVLQRLEPVHLRHDDVDERDVERLVADRLERGFSVAHTHDVVPPPAQEGAEDLREVLFILGNQYANSPAACRLGHAALAGSRMRKMLPSPTTLSTSIRPPCSLTIA